MESTLQASDMQGFSPALGTTEWAEMGAQHPCPQLPHPRDYRVRVPAERHPPTQEYAQQPAQKELWETQWRVRGHGRSDQDD